MQLTKCNYWYPTIQCFLYPHINVCAILPLFYTAIYIPSHKHWEITYYLWQMSCNIPWCFRMDCTGCSKCPVLPHTGQLCNARTVRVGYCVSRADQDCDYDCIPCTMYIVFILLSYYYYFFSLSFIDFFFFLVLCMHLVGMPLISLCTDLSV